ncbi:MAG: alanine dehydrogenase [Armatimonadota bacterium]
MIIGVPKEIKDGENRVAATPAGVHTLVRDGHQVLVQTRAGEGSGISDDEYADAGGTIVENAEETYERADMVMKVKEPLPGEYKLLQPGQILFTYLHLASSREMTEALMEADIYGVAYETVQAEDGSLPLLRPMSEVAGKMATQVGAQSLEKHGRGRGVLLGGVTGVAPADVVVVGCGTVGQHAAMVATGMGARVYCFDVQYDKLSAIDALLGNAATTMYSNPYDLGRALKWADLVIGAVLIPGGRAPHVITEAMVKEMREGAVLVDVAIDQGGCIETMEPTSHSEPTYTRHGVVHYAVPNIPAAVPRTSTFALTNNTLPYARKLANMGLQEAMDEDEALASGLNVARGELVHPAVKEAFPELC